MSMIKSVVLPVTTVMAPLLPAGTIAAFARIFPFGELSVDTPGKICPAGHAERKSVSVRLLRASDGSGVELHRLHATPGWGLSVSPDGRQLLFTQFDAENATVNLFQNFR